jgi:hypothetical protein
MSIIRCRHLASDLAGTVLVSIQHDPWLISENCQPPVLDTCCHEPNNISQHQLPWQRFCICIYRPQL